MQPETLPENFSFLFEELEATPEMLSEAMGYPEDKVPEFLPPIMESVLDEAPRHIEPRGGFVILEPERVRIEKKTFHIDEACFDAGRIICGGLKKARGLAVFLATAGPGIEAWRDGHLNGDDPVRGYVIDALGSEAAERTAERIQDLVAEQVSQETWGVTDRYSPGYCDWHVREQHGLFSFLPAGFCGISLTDSALMQPIKSVSGVIGLGPEARPEGYICHRCTMEQCFRKNSRPC